MAFEIPIISKTIVLKLLMIYKITIIFMHMKKIAEFKNRKLRYKQV